jgi:hypothetical protein
VCLGGGGCCNGTNHAFYNKLPKSEPYYYPLTPLLPLPPEWNKVLVKAGGSSRLSPSIETCVDIFIICFFHDTWQASWEKTPKKQKQKDSRYPPDIMGKWLNFFSSAGKAEHFEKHNTHSCKHYVFLKRLLFIFDSFSQEDPWGPRYPSVEYRQKTSIRIFKTPNFFHLFSWEDPRGLYDNTHEVSPKNHALDFSKTPTSIIYLIFWRWYPLGNLQRGLFIHGAFTSQFFTLSGKFLSRSLTHSI